MNNKILKTLEFGKITHRLSELAITAPAKKRAEKLVPSNNFDQVKLNLQQTLALANLLRIKGQLPLTDFNDVRPSTKRLSVKANLNAKELGNLLLVLSLANSVNDFLD
ncbi:MAG TPA: endonuclease MutS2, partial [Lactobacillus acetotolerans]|nr:endonuclease MutS2 [Lactobacillus acetotolerans]